MQPSGNKPAIASRDTPDGAAKGAAMAGTDVATYARERPGLSAFVLEDGVIYHTYSAYARGLDILWNAYQWLDRAPKGRNEPATGGGATTSTTSTERFFAKGRKPWMDRSSICTPSNSSA